MTTEDDDPSRGWRYVVGGLIGAAVVVVVLGLLFAPGRPPQMGANEDVFRTVDALFTAIQNRDPKRVTECERRLHGYRETGALPTDAAARLDRIIRAARGGGWESAAERLYDFMLGQRRDGVAEARPKPAMGKRK